MGLNQLLLNGHQVALGIEHFEVAHGAAVIAQFGKAGAFALHIAHGAQNSKLLTQPMAGRKRIRHVAEGRLHSLLVAHYGLIAPDFGQIKRGTPSAAIK